MTHDPSDKLLAFCIEENQTNEKQESLQKAIDEIRETFDFLSIQKASRFHKKTNLYKFG